MIIRDFINLIFPEVCLYCNAPTVKGEELLCSNCILDLPKSGIDNHLLKKFSSLQNVTFAYSYLKFSKKGAAQKLLHQLKYEGNQEVGTTLGRWFGADLYTQVKPLVFDLIIPIPIHKSRQRSRGYNQSDLIAEGLSDALEITWSNKVAKRVKKTATQTAKGKVERWQNVETIFQINDSAAIKDKKVVVVDDVITTGATINAFAEALFEVGAKEIGVLAIASAE